jgi:hypothetical protein
MSGSGASNLGYGNTYPNNNVNPNYINIDSSTYNGGFGTNQIPGLPGLSGDKWNVAAAAGVNPFLKGGFRRKIKNITKMYKMKGGKGKLRSLKKKLASLKKQLNTEYKKSMKKRQHKHTKSCRHSYKKKSLTGGYSQFQNNLPYTNTYSTGGILSSSQSALANPVPYQVLSNCTNCQDNYNHYTGKGSPSAGH